MRSRHHLPDKESEPRHDSSGRPGLNYLYDSGCDPTNRCWWQPQGQMEYLYRVAYDCDGDGYADTFSWVTVEGDCCW